MNNNSAGIQQQNSNVVNSAFSSMLLKSPNQVQHSQQLQEQAIAAMKFSLGSFSSNNKMSNNATNPSNYNLNGMSDIYNAFHQFPYFSFTAAQQLASVAAVAAAFVTTPVSSALYSTAPK